MLPSSPVHLIFTSTLILGTMMSLSSNNWLMIWMGLEVNLLSFIPIMTITTTNQETEGSIKYFLTQAFASMLLLLSAISLSLNLTNLPMWPILLSISLLIKMGMAPYHFWFPLVMNSLPWLMCLILSSWQKLAPLILLLFLPMKFITSLTFFMTILFSAMIGALGGLNQTQLRPLMAYSSINHFAWIITSMIFSKMIALIYFMIYIMNSILLMLSFHHSFSSTPINLNNISSISLPLKTIIILSTFSLAGLPPLLGFLPKWLLIETAMDSSSMLPMILLLIFSSLITLFFYLNMMFIIMLNYTSSQKSPSFKFKPSSPMLLLPILSLIMISPTLLL